MIYRTMRVIRFDSRITRYTSYGYNILVKFRIDFLFHIEYLIFNVNVTTAKKVLLHKTQSKSKNIIIPKAEQNVDSNIDHK